VSIAQPRLLLVDNYDSFTYNLVQAFLVLGAEVLVYRNDEISVAQALERKPSHLCISPGPGRPDDAGVSLAMLAAFEQRLPILGVCLGHQSLVQHFGGRIISAPRLMHGKISMITHDGAGVYAGLSQPFQAGRYHSLAAEEESMPAALMITSPAANAARSWACGTGSCRSRACSSTPKACSLPKAIACSAISSP
jgi:anthranilate synthase/aminodeoxychorismate synthase-like glutamine amidotransferase